MKKLTVKALEKLLKKAERAHAAYQKKLGRTHKNWSNWYAKFIIGKLER